MFRLGPVLLQTVAFAAFIYVIGIFSSGPVYTHLPPGMSLIKMNFAHAGQRKEECRQLSPEELQRLAPNMRRQEKCKRERVPVYVEVHIDGKPAYVDEIPPSGLARDGTATVYRRFPLAPGEHTLLLRLGDSLRREGYDYERRLTVSLAPGQQLAIDFRADTGGFLLL